MDIQTYSPENLKKWRKVQIALWRTKRFFSSLVWSLIWRNFFLTCIGLTLLYVAFSLEANAQWVGRPYAGFLHQNRVIIENSFLITDPDNLLDTPADRNQATIVKKGTIIVAVDQQPVPSSAWLVNYLQQHEGEMVTYTFMGANGELNSIEMPVLLFQWQDFIQMAAIPALVGVLILITAGTIIYIGYELFSVRLFALFCLALAFHLVSFPGFVTGQLAILSLTLALIGRIVLPSLLLHLLLVLYQSKKDLTDWPFLLPLIYLPIVPGVIHLTQLFGDPIAHRNFVTVIDAYTVVYVVSALLLLFGILFKARSQLIRIRVFVLMIGLTLPTCLLLVHLSLNPETHPQLLSTIATRYWAAGIPFAIIWLAIRYEDFGFKIAQRSYLLYLRTLLIGLLGYICLITILNPSLTSFDLIYWQDIPIILIGTALFFIVRLLYINLHNLTADLIYGSIDEFRNGYRIVSRNLTKVETRRDLERLVGLDLPSDFRLRSAEITSRDKKSNIRHTLAYPLTVNNLNVGNLYLGGKIDGKLFTTKELEIIDELKKQISLAMWSFELDENIHTIEELTRLKSRFLAHVTHELRTPLNGIINYIGFVLDDDEAHLNHEQRDHLERALESAEKLLLIINNILDMSKIEAGQMKLYRQPGNLASIVTEITPIIEQRIEDKPVELIIEVAPDLPEIAIDRLRMRQILLNLLFNAAKFTQAGTIRLNIWSEKGKIMITIADTGPGIDARLRPTLFQQFMSDGLMDADQNLGPGLSMPITKALVELHGGQIDWLSESGQGTTFMVMLPIRLMQSTNGHKN
ncbi:MAG: hypothetical protein KDJ52_19280 [Anaerolineae bacterium]|nr:hypothetical protein [Anaerolineae bacterium]